MIDRFIASTHEWNGNDDSCWIVCEVECDTDEQLALIIKPEWAFREITGDPAYSGSVIASGALPIVN